MERSDETRGRGTRTAHPEPDATRVLAVAYVPFRDRDLTVKGSVAPFNISHNS